MTETVITSKSNFETSSKLSIDNGRTDGSLKVTTGLNIFM